jgi:CRP/FNR family transcriptional regulator, cyclic AMP receptor protein
MSAETLATILQTHPFTEGFWPEHIARLAAMASEVRFGRDELIFHEGDHSSLFYLLVEGNVALEVVTPGRAVRVSTLYGGDAAGWSSVVDVEGKQFQTRALEEVHALAFDGARLRHACDQDYAFGFAFMRAVVKVLANRVHATRQQLQDAYTPVGAKTQ